MNTNDDYRQQLMQLLCGITDPQEMDAALDALLTSRELEEVTHRVQIFRLLAEQHPQREIATMLGVGIATVTRGAHACRSRGGQIILQRLTGMPGSHPEEESE